MMEWIYMGCKDETGKMTEEMTMMYTLNELQEILWNCTNTSDS